MYNSQMKNDSWTQFFSNFNFNEVQDFNFKIPQLITESTQIFRIKQQNHIINKIMVKNWITIPLIKCWFDTKQSENGEFRPAVVLFLSILEPSSNKEWN